MKPSNNKIHSEETSPIAESAFSVWIDADSCPRPVRDMILRFTLRMGLRTYFVANRQIPFPPHPLCEMIVSSDEPDAADDYITDNAARGDMVITRDIPLAARLVQKNIRVLNDRGTVYTEENINERLSMRNFMLDLYNQGIMPERTSVLGKKEIGDFANSLDRELQRLLRAAKNREES